MIKTNSMRKRGDGHGGVVAASGERERGRRRGRRRTASGPVVLAGWPAGGPLVGLVFFFHADTGASRGAGGARQGTGEALHRGCSSTRPATLASAGLWAAMRRG